MSGSIRLGDSNGTLSRLAPVSIAVFGLLGLVHLWSAFSHPSVDLDVLRQVRYDVDFSLLHQNEDVHNGVMKYVHNGHGADVIPLFNPEIDVKRLPRIAWVVTAPPNVLQRHGQEVTNLACYAERLGIPFFLEHQLLSTDRSVLTSRHRGVAKHLPYFQWIISTDADFIVADSSRDIRQFLDDSMDIIFNDRDYMEICTCAFLIRNSPGGWSFFRRWWSWSDHEDHLNSDNGDVVEMAVAGLHPFMPNNANFTGRFNGEDSAPISPDMEACVNGNLNPPYPHLYHYLAENCTVRALYDIRHADDSIPYWDLNLWTWTDILPPVAFRSYKIFAGFARQGEGTLNLGGVPHQYPRGYPMYLTTAIEGDLLLHGKTLDMPLGPESLLCTGQEWRYPKESWTVEQTRREFASLGFTWWPGCFDDEGKNHCLDSAGYEYSVYPMH